ncbi:FdhF/YdeP family oxidoreductase [Aurantivibrio plasticivorans]
MTDVRSKSIGKPSDAKSEIVGGGVKKILYTLNTVRRIGLLDSAKALTSRNACKACGLGMGGQHGGMTNEVDEFPSVCNKSVQAQSTDIQPGIPPEVFDHPLSEFKKLSGKEIESLGRLTTPLYKSKTDTRFQPIAWDDALEKAASAFKQAEPDQTFFYSSGRSSNEAGYLLQLLARVYGTNNINNCSYYCHQATGVGLQNVIGSGTATITLDDLHGCDLVFIIGANPASNHPRLIHKLKACRERGGQVIIINPAREPGLVKFAVPKSAKSLIAGGSEIASDYLQPNIGSDALLMVAIAKALIEKNEIQTSDANADHYVAKHFIQQHCEQFEPFLASINALGWDDLVKATGIDQARIESIAECYANAKHVVFAWGMGITHHTHGVENVEAIANLALLRGMVGKANAGLLPLRGHSNVQGIGTIGVKPELAQPVLKALQAQGVIAPQTRGMDTLACIESAERGDIKAALIMGGNLYEATPNSAWAERSLNTVGTKVYLTTTLNRGHVHGMDDSEAIIFPVTARDEEPQPTTQESMFNYVRLSDGGIKRLVGPRSETAILCEFAQRLGVNERFDFAALQDHQSIRRSIAQTIPGMKSLKDIDQTKQEFHVDGRILREPVFNTPTKKASFAVHDWAALIKYENAQWPFQLMSVRSEGQFNSIIYEEQDSYRGASHRWVVFLSPDDIDALKLKAGDKVNVQSAIGVMKEVVVVAFDLPPGNVMAYYPEANCLIGTERDPRSQTPAFKSVPVNIQVV